MAKKRNLKNKALISGWQGVYPKKDFENAFVIGLAGFSRAGKTTIAERVVLELKRNFGLSNSFKFSFATRIKEVLTTLVGEEIDWDRPETKKLLLYEDGRWTTRDFMIQFGTEFVRKGVGDCFWVDVAAKRLASLQEPTVVVIDDVRFPGEVELVQSLGVGVLIERSGVGQAIKHVSEEPNKLVLKNTVRNNGTPQQAAEAILGLAQKHPHWST